MGTWHLQRKNERNGREKRGGVVVKGQTEGEDKGDGEGCGGGEEGSWGKSKPTKQSNLQRQRLPEQPTEGRKCIYEGMRKVQGTLDHRETAHIGV